MHRASLKPTYTARLLGQHIVATDDPSIGSALPAFAGYLYHDNHITDGAYQWQSVLQANVQKNNNTLTEIQIGGQVVFVSEGTLFL